MDCATLFPYCALATSGTYLNVLLTIARTVSHPFASHQISQRRHITDDRHILLMRPSVAAQASPKRGRNNKPIMQMTPAQQY